MGSKFKTGLRWIFLFPLSMLLAMLIDFPLHFILYSILSGGSTPLITPYPQMPELILAPFFRAIVFVFSSLLIAPSHNLKVAKIFSVLWVVIAVSGYLIVQVMSRSNIEDEHLSDLANSSILPIISGIMGAILSMILIFRVWGKKYSSNSNIELK